MPRIRTIKPEFPQSESMGRVSREARLCFILLWTIADDSGRLRASSRMLASLLYPYDDDAPRLIDGWLSELEREACIKRYTIDNTTYCQIAKWLNHQKIDRPTPSRLPEFDESSRVFDESSSTDLGPWTLDQDLGSGKGSLDSRQRDKKKSTTEIAKPDPQIAQAVEMYNDLARECGLPVAQHVTDTRRRSLKKRLAEAGGIDGWAHALAQIRASDYLRGRVNGWRANLDFMLQASSFTKIMEGAYANGPKRHTSSGNGFLDLARREGDLPSTDDDFEGFADV